MRPSVEADQEIDRLDAGSRHVFGPGSGPSLDFAGEWFTELVGRAINGVELPDYVEAPDFGAPAGPLVTSSAEP